MSDNKRTGRGMFGKGYYIALILCAAAIGITGYLYNRSETKQTDIPVQGNPTESTLSGIFSNIIQGQKNLLRPVENIVYEDGMGLSAWVNKKRVLIGNRALMQHYGVDTPSKDFEAKYCRDHRDILYLLYKSFYL